MSDWRPLEHDAGNAAEGRRNEAMHSPAWLYFLPQMDTDFHRTEVTTDDTDSADSNVLLILLNPRNPRLTK